MEVEVIAAERLTPEHVAVWSRLLADDATLANPFFRPEFTQAVAAVRPDTEVAILRVGGEIAGFFPYQRGRGDVASPVGGPLNDFQGIVVRQGLALDPRQLLRDCRLSAWHFNHLLASQQALGPYQRVFWDSPYLDLRGGFAAYRDAKEEAGGGVLAKVDAYVRRIEREIGPLRLVPHTPEPDLFALVVEWKIRQYQRIKATNFLAPAWTRALLDRIRTTQTPAFAGMLSVLYGGDRPVALHMGMRSCRVLHAWYPVYDAELSKYSPGMVLWVQLARAAESLGIERIDLGRGQESYKLRLQSASVRLAEGAVDLRRLAGPLRTGWLRTREWVRASPLCGPGRTVLRYARQWFQPQDR